MRIQTRMGRTNTNKLSVMVRRERRMTPEKAIRILGDKHSKERRKKSEDLQATIDREEYLEALELAIDALREKDK